MKTIFIWRVRIFILWIFVLVGYSSVGQITEQKAAAAVAAEDVSFEKQVLTEDFIAEGVAVGDVNRDGKTDILAGAYWFEAPDWKEHELVQPEVFYYDKGYSNAFSSHAMDVNLDGWVDFLRLGFPGEEALWFENPKNKKGHWEVHKIHSTVGNESAGFFDVNGDGRLDLLGGNPATGQMNWFKAPVSKENLEWQQSIISKEQSPGTAKFAHGLGMGDINGDGRKDVIINEGWWEAPEDYLNANWIFHPADLGEASAQIYAYDFDNDGDQDVVSSSAHKVGIWWHEQKLDGQGNLEWQTHLISDEFTQTHALALKDIDLDGDPDLVTGKRYFAHMGHDLGGMEPPVLYWFEFKPSENPSWVPHLIDDNSGVGVQIVTKDITNDDLVDIIVANKKGVFLFQHNKPEPVVDPVEAMSELPLKVGYGLSIKNFTPERLAYSKSVGVDYVEASGMGNIVDGELNFMHSDEEIVAMLTQAKKAADEAGIDIWSIHMPFGKNIDLSIIDEGDRQEVVEMHKKLIGFLEILEPEIILFHPSYYLGLNERAMRKGQLIKSTKELDEAVQAIGATMVLENMLGSELLKDENRERPLMRTVGEVEEIFGHLPKSIGLAIDMNHIKNPEDLIRAMGDRLKTVHIADGTGRAENHFFPCSGEGENDWQEILAALEEVGYTGPFMFESDLPSSDEKDYLECYQSLYETYLRNK